MKPTVQLRAIYTSPTVGNPALIQTIDHPSHRVTNWPEGDGWVRTSLVVSVSEDGFETMNTIYRKHPDLFREEWLPTPQPTPSDAATDR